MSAVKENTKTPASISEGPKTAGILEKSKQGEKKHHGNGNANNNSNGNNNHLKPANSMDNSPQTHQEQQAMAYYQSGVNVNHNGSMNNNGGGGGYYTYQQPNPTPTSPASASLGNVAYDVQSLLAQQPSITSMNMNAFANNNQNTNNINGTPLSPGRETTNVIDTSNLPPASPLFPGTTLPLYSGTSPEQLGETIMNGASMFASNATPSFQYLSGPPPSPVISYGYPPSIPNSPDVRNSWTDRNLQQQQQQHIYNVGGPAPSPHLQGVPVQYQGNMAQTRRTTSFDGGEMLPPSAIEDSPPGMFHTGGTLLHQQPWAPPPDLYSPQQPIQHHLTSPARNGAVQGRGTQHISMAPPPPVVHGSYYPAATPGPPIQTTQNNKGPDGANLFIFHIPNHFTNLDMWHLFCHYGTLLSVRIMVEKDTGRSRGFGFVSYDSPDAAAMAIKELNGFVIGNKRLKVQHKQIRQSENNNNPGQQQHQQPHEMAPHPQSFQESNVAPNNGNVNWTGNEQNERRPLATHRTDTQLHSPVVPPSIPDVSEENNVPSDHLVGSKLADLTSIREALPDVQ